MLESSSHTPSKDVSAGSSEPLPPPDSSESFPAPDHDKSAPTSDVPAEPDHDKSVF